MSDDYMDTITFTSLTFIDKGKASFYNSSSSNQAMGSESTQSMERTANEKDFINLLTEYQGKVFGYIYSQTADPDATNEILQETCLVLWKKRDQFEPGTNFKAWAKSIAYFQIKAHKQKKFRDRLVFDDQVMERIDKQADKLEERRDIRKDKLTSCISQLQEKYRNFVTKRYQEGISVNDIATQEGIPANTVTQALFRVRQKLIECVKTVDVA